MRERFLPAILAVLVLLAVIYAVPRPARLTLGQYSAEPVLILDAGHGGEDGGTVAADGTKESDLNLQIVMRLEALSALCGRKTYLIRREDRSVYDPDCTSVSEKKRSDLRNRVEMVNSLPGATFLSIHQNQFPVGKYHGAQVFYGTVGNSKDLAEAVQKSLRESVDPANKRKCKPSEGVYLMQNIRNPGILVECGFLSNPAECEYLKQADYQKKLAAAILAPILRAGRNSNGENKDSLLL